MRPEAKESCGVPLRRRGWPLSRWIDVQLIAMLEEELTGEVSDEELEP